MIVPKAPVYKNNLPPRREYHIWLAGQIGTLETIPISKSVQQSPNSHLRLHAL